MKIGIIGTGTVGSGTIELILDMAAEWKQKLGVDLQVAMVCAKDQAELAPYASRGLRTTTSADELIADSQVDVVCELAGGYDLPRKWILAALQAGKHVVTANKALIAKYGHEIFPLAASKGLHVLFEASVGGGIPIIRTLQEGLTGNRVQTLSCIINGTCNYILTRMSRQGLGFPEALAEAQAKGYAEADPTFDIEGIDSAHKLALLASLASNQWVDFEKMHVTGVSRIEAQDIQYAAELGCTIKLLGVFRQVGSRVDARVHPCLLPNEHLLSGVNQVLNAVYLECDRLGPTLLTGAGAGKWPTASAVAADLVSLARSLECGERAPIPMAWFNHENKAQLVPIEELSTRYYFRFTTKDACGVLAQITGILASRGISIESIIQKNVQDPGKVSIVVITESTQESEVLAALAQIDALDAVSEPSRMLRFLA